MITYRNRHGDLYYLHEGRTKTGKPKYFFSRKRDGALVAAVPAGFEVYESPNALVLLRRTVPSQVTSDEARTVSDALKQNVKARNAIVETKGDAITVFMSSFDPGESAGEMVADFPFTDRTRLASVLQRSVYYSPMMQFVLLPYERTRTFQAERWCCMGGIDDWIAVGSPGSLPEIARQFCRHLGKESFFELM